MEEHGVKPRDYELVLGMLIKNYCKHFRIWEGVFGAIYLNHWEK